ncbi:MAG: hypothetical protein A3G76_08160 [Acidobacteria bacterium RIFCSPLOWO2_12_FULL_65_11]|nr:MAG: hypothetical protein A3H95_14425 [Acidobacteria bacterium RIFCSPLOWO2_02_FULL_64_15]OFW28381.1 MAG: hypothetical protein A3G76_08160 [Acidobacteria bacterium RIFCSPLOWO2_12_FULL_65_11]
MTWDLGEGLDIEQRRGSQRAMWRGGAQKCAATQSDRVGWRWHARRVLIETHEMRDAAVARVTHARE